MKFLGYFRDLTHDKKKLFSELEEDNTNGVPLYTSELPDHHLRIVAAANRYPNDIVVVSARHHDRCMNDQLRLLKEAGLIASTHTPDMGFIDNQGVYHSRESALVVATQAGQINFVRKKGFPKNMLFSEDLY